MDMNHEEILRICENPLQTTSYDVWKLREKIANVDYRSRRKGTSVENKLGPYDDATGKEDTDKLKDRPTDYTCIDEYCKVSELKRSDELEEDTRPKQLKTNTAFGRSKIPFDRFTRQHIGGGDISDYTLTQPLDQRCHRGDTQIRNAEGNHDRTAPRRDYYEPDDLTLMCCGHDVEKLVDYCTCMFCAKGLFYHCKDSCSEDASDDPCSCTPTNTSCVKRWTVLGVLAIFLPCLLCYPVASSCTKVCKCYENSQESTKRHRNRTLKTRDRERLT